MHELMLKVLRPRLTRLPFSPVVASPKVGVGRAAENDRSRTPGNVPRFRTKYVLEETWLIASAKPEASSEGGVSFVRRSHSENEYFPLLSAASVLRTPPFRLGKSTFLGPGSPVTKGYACPRRSPSVGVGIRGIPLVGSRIHVRVVSRRHRVGERTEHIG